MARSKKGRGRKKAAKRAASKKSKARRRRSAKSANKKAAVRKKQAKKASKKPSKAAKRAVGGRFNLIVTFDPNHVGTAENELNEVLKRIGEKPKIAASEVGGLFKAAVSDARRVVARLGELCRADPNLFAATHRYTPIDSWCKSEVAQMQKSIKPLVPGIGASEKWKMGLNKRHWDRIGATELIIKLTEVIDREKVDLSSPEKIVQVEIIGKEAGVSLLAPGDVLDVAEVKGRS